MPKDVPSSTDQPLVTVRTFYNALLASYQHRLSHGINLGLNYSFSKVLDTADSYSNSVSAFVDPRSRNYGTSMIVLALLGDKAPLPPKLGK